VGHTVGSSWHRRKKKKWPSPVETPESCPHGKIPSMTASCPQADEETIQRAIKQAIQTETEKYHIHNFTSQLVAFIAIRKAGSVHMVVGSDIDPGLGRSSLLTELWMVIG
jgi:hypothetical protein